MTKSKIISKKVTKKNKVVPTNRLYLVAIAILALVLTGYMGYRSMVAKSGINEVKAPYAPVETAPTPKTAPREIVPTNSKTIPKIKTETNIQNKNKIEKPVKGR